MIRILMVFLAAAAVGSASAVAEVPGETIRAFNTAVTEGDAEARRRAATDLAAAAMSTPEDERAALFAFESAWTLCEIDRCEGASEPARFAASQPAGEEHPVAADRALLVAYVDWTAKKNRRTRATLDEALTAVVNTEPSMLSLAAFSNRLASDMDGRNWKRLMDSAGQAARHFESIKHVAGRLWSFARTAEIAASFNVRPDIEQHRAMAHLESELGAMYAAVDHDTEAPDWLKKTYYGASAWKLAIGAHLYALDEPHLSDDELDEIQGQYDLMTLDNVEEDLPFCEGDFNYSPPLRFPRSSAFRGLVGSVILGFAIDEGEVRDIAVLAAVPEDGFKERALNAAKRWQWEWDEIQPEQPCTKSRENIALPLVFQLRR